MRASGSFARACSGDMYGTVPKVLPGLVSWLLSTPSVARGSALTVALFAALTFARPKSRILGWPRSVTKLLAGLMSR